MCSALVSIARSTAKIAAAAMLVLCLSALSFGQAGLTSVQGRVTDSTGAVIPGVTVTVTNTATAASRQVITDEQGVYNVTQLQPGTYNIKIELAGFKTQELDNVPLPVDQVVTRNVALAVGAVTDVVQVSSSAETVNTENAELGNNFAEKQIIDLPLNARNIVGLLSLQNGVSVNVNTTTQCSTTSTTTCNDSVSGYVNGARNDQQNITLDGVDINQQQSGSSFQGALPTTLDSVQEFVVQTSGQGAAAARSGAQIQLVTKSGSNSFHGSIYEAYRSKVTTATPYFNGQLVPKPGLIRNIPGGSFGGPIIKNKLFFFGAFERHTDRSQTLVTRTVPTTNFMNGVIEYQRSAKAGGPGYGVVSQGCGSQLEAITGVSCDTFNPALKNFLAQYAPYVNNPGQYGGSLSCTGDCSMTQNFQFNAPNNVTQNIYISRIDYTINPKNTIFVRGTLNNQANLSSPTFPGINNALTTYDNSKGFAATWNSVISPTMNNNFTAGLTRQDGNTTGNAAVSYSLGPSSLFQSSGPSHNAIDTWTFNDNLSLIKGSHALTMGVNFGFIDNNLHSYNVVKPGSFSSEQNFVVGDFGGACGTTCANAIGADWVNVANASDFETDILQGIGGLNQYQVGLQWDKNGNPLPLGTAFDRIIRLDQYDFYLQDSWKIKPTFSLNYGIHWGVVTPPWEKNGNEVNWDQNQFLRYETQKESPYTSGQLPLLTGQLAGRANGLPDYYPPALNNWAPRISFAYSPKDSGGILGILTSKGGPMSIRGGYSLTFDHTGGSLATNAAQSGAIGLFSNETLGSSSFSINGVGKPAVPRVSQDASGNLILPTGAYQVSAAQSFTPPVESGWSGPSLLGIDNNLRPPLNHQVNLTVSKELPAGFVLDVSYVGRFARGLFSVLDMANPVNYVDPVSGQDYYSAMKQLITQYENNSVGASAGKFTSKNVAQAVAGIQPIPWFENAYGGVLNWAETGKGAGIPYTGCPVTVNPCTAAGGGTQAPDASSTYPGVTFQNATQAYYAVLNYGIVPGPNAAFVNTNVQEFYEQDTAQHILTNTQSIYDGLFTNVGISNYNAGQFNLKKRFSQGYTLNLGYTWAKSMDTTSTGESAGTRPGGSGSSNQIIDPYNPQKNYALSGFNRAGQLTANFIAELPFGQGKPLFSNMPGYLDRVFGGWQVSGIWTSATGTPFDYLAGLRYTLHYEGQDIPIPTAPIPTGKNYAANTTFTEPEVFWIQGPSQSASCTATCYQANRIAAANNFTNVYPDGPINRNNVIGPGYQNLDASVMKNFKFGDKLTSRFEADAFNVMNHPNFQNPTNTNIDKASSGLLGNITTIAGTGSRVMQFQLRFQF